MTLVLNFLQIFACKLSSLGQGAELLPQATEIRHKSNIKDKVSKKYGFLMISWFARFKNRFGKLLKNMKKGVEKAMQKTLENR